MCAVLVAAACGDGDSGDGGLDVTSDTVSHATTQDILVFAPDAEGSWPVVVVMHGVGGRAEDMAEFATHLARDGLVVFVPNYRTVVSSEEGIEDAGRDGECAYRFARISRWTTVPRRHLCWRGHRPGVIEHALQAGANPSQPVPSMSCARSTTSSSQWFARHPSDVRSSSVTSPTASSARPFSSSS
jgi:hypothetical protein